MRLVTAGSATASGTAAADLDLLRTPVHGGSWCRQGRPCWRTSTPGRLGLEHVGPERVLKLHEEDTMPGGDPDRRAAMSPSDSSAAASAVADYVAKIEAELRADPARAVGATSSPSSSRSHASPSEDVAYESPAFQATIVAGAGATRPVRALAGSRMRGSAAPGGPSRGSTQVTGPPALGRTTDDPPRGSRSGV